MKKRIISFLTAFVMMLSLMPQNIITVSAATFDSGAGTAAEPYIITTASQLEQIGGEENKGKYFKLNSDITVDENFKTIDAFYGVLNGNGKKINGVNITETITGPTSANSQSVTAITETKGRLFNTIETNAVVYGLYLNQPTYTLKFGITPDSFKYCKLNKGLFTNTNKGIINGLSIFSAKMTTITNKDEGTHLFWIDNYGGVAYNNTSTGKILNSDINVAMTISAGQNIGGIVGKNDGIIANIQSSNLVYLKSYTGNFKGVFTRVSPGVGLNYGTMYNIYSVVNSFSEAEGSDFYDTTECGLLCGNNAKFRETIGKIDTCTYRESTSIVTAPIGNDEGKSTNNNKADTSVDWGALTGTALETFKANSNAKQNEIPGLIAEHPLHAYENLGGMYFSEMWKDSTLLKRENHTISATQKLPYSLDKEYYCESWSVNGTSKNSGETVNITGNTKIVAQNVKGKYYLTFDGATKSLAPAVAIPQNYDSNIVWKQVGVEGTSTPNSLPTMTITMAKSTSTSTPSDDAFAVPSTGTTEPNDKFWYKYTIPESEDNYKFKSGTYNMYASYTPSYSVAPIDVTTENYKDYFDIKINSEDTYRSDNNYGYGATVKNGYTVRSASLKYKYLYDGYYDITSAHTYNVLLEISGGNFASKTIDTGLTVTIKKDDPVLSISSIDANLKYGKTMQVTVDAKDRLSNKSFTDGTARLYLYPEGGSSSNPSYTSDDVIISDTTTFPYTFNVTELPNANEKYVCEFYYIPKSSNYNTTSTTQNFTVGKGTSAVKVSFDKEAYTYGEDVGIIVSGVPSDADESTLTLDDTSIEGAENITFVEKTASGDYKFKYANPQAGERNIKVSFSGSGNYNGSADDKSVTVSKRALTATASSVKETNTYGKLAAVKLNVGTYNSEAVSVSDLKLLVKNGETIVKTIPIDETNLPITDKAVILGTTLDAGTYNLFVTIDDTTGNYTSPTDQCEEITIEKRDPTAADLSYTLDDNVQYSTLPDKLEITAAEGVTGLGSVTAKYKNAGEDAFRESKPVSLGNYELWAEVSDGANINSGTVKLKDFTIIKKTITVDDMIIKINGEAPKKSYIYTGVAPTVEITPKEKGAFTVDTVNYYRWEENYGANEGYRYVPAQFGDFKPGNYKIEAYFTGSDNYAESRGFEVAKYTLTKADLDFKHPDNWKDSHESSEFKVKYDGTAENIMKYVTSIYPTAGAYPTASKFSAKIVNTATGEEKEIKTSGNVYCNFYINIKDIIGGQKYQCEITYDGCDYYNPTTFTTNEFSIGKINISFNVSNTTHDYDETAKQINVSTTPNYIPSEEITVNYYKVNETGDALVSTESVTPTDVGTYMYVISVSEERQAQCTFAKEQYTVTDTTIPEDFTLYGNVGLMTIKQGYEQAVWNETESRYEISNANQLMWFADQVNQLDEFKAKNAILMDNIVLNDNVLVDGALNTDADTVSGFTAWTPIGSETNPYCGTFDGNNKTVSGLYFNNATNNVGLFGYLGTGGNITNVDVVDSYINGSSNIGGVCGYNNGGNITGCYNTSIVNGTSNIGGVCGYNKGVKITDGTIIGGTITGCYNKGAVTTTSELVGGLCGSNEKGTITSCYNTGTITGTNNQYIGGLCGKNDQGTFKDSYNEGTVSGNKYLGGVCGMNSYGRIENCYTKIKSTVKATGTSSFNFVGGVCGYTQGGNVIGCYNEGTVTYSRTGDYMAGVCGYNNGTTITNCYNKSAISVSGITKGGGICSYNYNGTLRNCYNEGAISGFSSNGGVCGYNKGTITSCYNTGKIEGSINGGICAENYSLIENCYNTGAITGSIYHIAGVCGRNNTGGTVQNCYNIGTITFDNKYPDKTGFGKNIGAIVGENNATVENVYYLENCNADGTTFTNTEGTSKDEKAFSSGAMAYLLNGETSSGTLVWGQLLSGDANADKSPVHLTTSNAGTHTVYSGYNGCTAAYSNSELPTEPTHIKTNSFKCASCQKTLVNIKDFSTAYRKLPADWTQSVYVVNGTTTAETPNNITVKSGSGVITVYFKFDGYADVAKSYTLTVKDSADNVVQKVTSQCNSIFGNIGMAEIVHTLPEGTYKVYVTLTAKNGLTMTTEVGTIKEPADESTEGSGV